MMNGYVFDYIVLSFKKYWRLLCVLFFLMVSFALVNLTKRSVPKENYDLMLEAAQKTQSAFSAIREGRLSLGHEISVIDDPDSTGIIGESYTEITTTLGSLESKRSAANPNNAAMIVDMLIQCGVKDGDTVAVNFSGSFPGLNTAVLCALDTLDVQGIVISSIGASTYGANLTDYTWLDMEQVLLDKGLINNHSKFFSLGGSGDIGEGMPEDTINNIVNRLKSKGLKLLYYENLSDNLNRRVAIYEGRGNSEFNETNETNESNELDETNEHDEINKPTCFINVGGNLLSFAGGTEMISSESGILWPSGLNSDFGQTGESLNTSDSRNQSETSISGLIPYFLSQNVPVIHLLNLKDLLPRWRLPFDPSPMPKAGEGAVYYEEGYNMFLVFVLCIAGIFLFFYLTKKFPHKKIPF